MKYLLDTHTLLWYLEANPQLSSTARRFIEDVSVQIFVSQINLMEIAIKLAINKLQLGMPFADVPNN